MTVRQIRSIGDPVLRARAIEIDPGDVDGAEVQQLVDDLIETMRDADFPVVGMCMGEIGTPSRILAGKFGAPSYISVGTRFGRIP